MIAVIFEVWPKQGCRQQYLDIAAELRPLLAEVDGLISIERCESLTQPGKSFHSPSSATRGRWHRGASSMLTAAPRRAGAMSSSPRYRRRIAGVIRDYGMDAREQAPQNSLAIHG